MTIETHIQGIPCTVELKHYKGYHGAREGGQQLEPDEPAGYTIEKVLKLGGKGKRMSWLENKMTDNDRDRIIREANDG